MIRALFKYLGRITSAVIVVCTFLAYLAPYVHPKWNSWLAHFATVFPWLLMANCGMLIFWLLRRDRFAIYHLLLLAIGWQHITAFVGMSSAQPKSNDAVTVFSHNLGAYLNGKNFQNQWEKAATDYIAFLKKNGDPDVVCIQESADVLRDLLIKKAGYAHHYFVPRKGNFILSRFPMQAGADIPFENTGNCAQWATIEAHGQKIRVFNVHLQSNYVSTQTDELIREGAVKKKESWLYLGRILDRISVNTIKRAAQADLVLKQIDKTDAPLLLCGDFNDTPNSYVYHLLANNMTDAFREKGRGLGYTFAGSLPLLRIDYVLASEQIDVLDAGVVHQKITDHYGTYAVVKIRG
jgi:endonuclease/exonuclease/phosphatase family metal-dependent hydrolase